MENGVSMEISENISGKSGKSMKLKIIFGVALLLGTIVILLATLIHLLTSNKISTCTTEECKLASKMILDSMDPNVDPCEDFYM